MTEVEDIRSGRIFDSLRKFLNRYDSVEEAERHRKGGFTATQARLFGEYYERRREQRELRGISVHFIVRRHHRLRVWSDKRGRFARHR